MLAYDRPLDTTASAPQFLKSSGPDLIRLAGVIWRRRVLRGSAALIGACLAIAAGKILPSKYTATAQLYVDPRELQLVERELTPRPQDMSGLTMVVESQARLITSNTVLLQVIKNARLDQDPEFGGGSAGWVNALTSLFRHDAPATSEGLTTIRTGALEALNRHISIRKTDRSFIVDVEVWSKDPGKAAMLANALANAYLAESRNSQFMAARRATTDLSSRLQELQERLRDAENKLATYKAQNNFIGTQDTLISDQQLSVSNQRLAVARAQMLDAKSRYDQIEASRRASGDGGAIPEALQSQTIANLRAQYAEARKRYAELKAELGPRHPALRQIEKQVDDVRKAIAEEIERFAQAARNDLVRARDYESSLAKALEMQKAQSVELSQASVRLRELERDVEANREVYQAFLKRSRETQEQESLNTSAARIIGEATVPQRRSFPPAISVLALIGLVFGALAGTGWTIATDERRQLGSPKSLPTAEPEQIPLAAIAQPARLAATAVSDPFGEKPVIAQLQEPDVVRMPEVKAGETLDLTRLGRPTLRVDGGASDLMSSLRDIRAAALRRTAAGIPPVIAIIGTRGYKDRSTASVNFALAAARDGVKLVMADAEDAFGGSANRISQLNSPERGRLGPLSSTATTASIVATSNGVSILAANGVDRTLAIHEAILDVRDKAEFEMVVMDGPAIPWDSGTTEFLEQIDAFVVVLPFSLSMDEAIEDILAALGTAEQKLVGVILNELGSLENAPRQAKQHA